MPCWAISLAISGVIFLPAAPKIRPTPGIKRSDKVSKAACGIAAAPAANKSVSLSAAPSSIWRPMFVAVYCAAPAPKPAPRAARPAAGTATLAAPAATTGATTYGNEPPSNSRAFKNGASAQPSSVGANISCAFCF